MVRKSTPSLNDLLTDLQTNAIAIVNHTKVNCQKPKELFTEGGPADFFLKEKKTLMERFKDPGILNKSLRKEMENLCQELEGLCSLMKDAKNDEALIYASDYLTVNIRLNQHANALVGLSEKFLQLLHLN
jgi:hypothetical protein